MLVSVVIGPGHGSGKSKKDQKGILGYFLTICSTDLGLEIKKRNVIQWCYNDFNFLGMEKFSSVANHNWAKFYPDPKK